MKTKTFRTIASVAISALIALGLISAASAADATTVDGKTRVPTGVGQTARFNKGDAVVGFALLLDDGRYCDGRCYTSSAPMTGLVTDGVIHPWRTEVKGMQEATWQSPSSAPAPAPAAPAASQIVPGTNCRSDSSECAFPETGKTVKGAFWAYWKSHGGLAQQGYPISDVTNMTSTDGKSYPSQVFERAVFELHPGDVVMLRLLGVEFLRHPECFTGSQPQPQPQANCKSGERTPTGENKKLRFEAGFTVIGWTLEFDNGKMCTNDCWVTCSPVGGWVTSGVINPWKEELEADRNIGKEFKP